MELLQQVVLNINRKYIKMRKEVQSVGKLSKHLKAKGIERENQDGPHFSAACSSALETDKRF